MLAPTPPQAAGPYLAIGLRPLEGAELVAPGSPGASVIEGRLLDGAGHGVPDGVVEIWQADATGRLPTGGEPFTGYGRSVVGPDGEYRFVTEKPGRLPSPFGGDQTPHLEVLVDARGLLRAVHTRLYFPDEAEANARDPVLAGVDPARRATLVAHPDRDALRFDIVLQGESETVFFGR